MTLSEIHAKMFESEIQSEWLAVEGVTDDPAERAAYYIFNEQSGGTFHSPWDFMEEEDQDREFAAMVTAIRKVYDGAGHPGPLGSGGPR